MSHRARRFRARAALAVLLVTPAPLAAQTAGSASPDEDQVSTFAAGVESVVVDVVVTDPDGQPVADLTAEDFQVEEDGKPQEITTFEAVTVEESFAVIGPDSDGELSQRINIPVRGAPPGEYEIVLRVEDEIAGAVVERRETFRIEAPEGAAEAAAAGR